MNPLIKINILLCTKNNVCFKFSVCCSEPTFGLDLRTVACEQMSPDIPHLNLKLFLKCCLVIFQLFYYDTRKHVLFLIIKLY